jgi:hypothetical protein
MSADWLFALAPGVPVRICTASTTRVDTVTVTAVTATEIRCGARRFTLDGRGIESATWLEPWRALRSIGKPRKQTEGATP